MDGGIAIDRDRRRHDRGPCAPVSALDAGIAEIGVAVAGTAEIAANIGIAITVITAITTITMIHQPRQMPQQWRN